MPPNQEKEARDVANARKTIFPDGIPALINKQHITSDGWLKLATNKKLESEKIRAAEKAAKTGNPDDIKAAEFARQKAEEAAQKATEEVRQKIVELSKSGQNNGIKIKRYYNHDGTPRRKMLKLEKRYNEQTDPPLTPQEVLAIQLKLDYSIAIDKEGKPQAFYEGKSKVLGEGSFGRVKHSQDLISKTFDVVKIAKKIDDPKKRAELEGNMKDEKRLAKKAGLHKGDLTRDDGRQYQFQKFGGQHDIFFQTVFDPNDSYFKDTYKGKAPKEKDFIDFEERLDISAKVFEQMQIMHEQHKILHRDIKSENILYDRNTGKTTIIDYGFAIDMPKPIIDANGKVVAGSVVSNFCGSPHAIAPEIPRKDGKGQFSEATDIYAGATVLMDMFGYNSPALRYQQFERESNQDMIFKKGVDAKGNIIDNVDPEIQQLRRATERSILLVIQKMTINRQGATLSEPRNINTAEETRRALEQIKFVHNIELAKIQKNNLKARERAEEARRILQQFTSEDRQKYLTGQENTLQSKLDKQTSELENREKAFYKYSNITDMYQRQRTQQYFKSDRFQDKRSTQILSLQGAFNRLVNPAEELNWEKNSKNLQSLLLETQKAIKSELHFGSQSALGTLCHQMLEDTKKLTDLKTQILADTKTLAALRKEMDSNTKTPEPVKPAADAKSQIDSVAAKATVPAQPKVAATKVSSTPPPVPPRPVAFVYEKALEKAKSTAKASMSNKSAPETNANAASNVPATPNDKEPKTQAPPSRPSR